MNSSLLLLVLSEPSSRRQLCVKFSANHLTAAFSSLFSSLQASKTKAKPYPLNLAAYIKLQISRLLSFPV